MNIKFIIAVIVLTVIVLFFSSSFSKSDETTTQPETVTTTQKITTTKPTQPDTTQATVSAAVSSPSDAFDVPAPNVGLYNLTAGKIIYEKKADEKISPASLAKILTAVTALTYMKSDTVITVGSELDLLPKGSSICLIAKGHKLTLYDLITGMLLASGNDAAYTIGVNVARHVSGSEKLSDREALDYFAELMNRIAYMLGCVNSNFKNPDGFDADGQYTTIEDLSVICNHAINFKVIREIVGISKKNVVFASGENITWSNTNKLLHSDSKFYMPEAIGMKTGTTNLAGNCLIAASEVNGQIYLSIVTGCKSDDDRYNSTKKLLSYPLSK